MRRHLSEHLDRQRRALWGQFFTPAAIALFMAESFEARQPVLRVLDAGAGVGSLSAAFVTAMARREHRPQAISITAFEIDPRLIPYLRLPPAEQVAFENHLNFYHVRGAGLPVNLARGLAAFLNSTLVDTYFRQFSGHTQVNATDLRSLRYPARDKLVRIGQHIGTTFPDQAEVDRLVREVVNRG
jgi:SAM-dependent methyltransferase